MQQQDKNDSVQLSTRYQQYMFAKGHLRGTSRPEVFPLGESNPKALKQIIGGGQGNRVYSTDGLSTTQASQAGGQGAKTGLYAVPVITPDRLNKRQNGRRMKENGEPAFTVTAQDRHGLYDGTKIRRLTPKECERLQGFPEIEKYDIIEVCKDNQKKNVNAEDQNHKSQKLVGNVEKKDSQENVKYVARFLNTKNQLTNKLVQPNVLINCEENGVEIHSQEKLLLNAKYAEKKNWCHQHIKIEDFVQMLVGINIMLEKIISLGEVDYLRNERYLILQKNGKRLESLFGKEIMQPVGGVENDLITLKKLLKSTTLDHLNTENLEQKLAILSSFAIRAITGYIPSEIKNQNTFTIGIKTKVGWTYGCSDSQRYHQCGNAVTTTVITAIMEKLLTSY